MFWICDLMDMHHKAHQVQTKNCKGSIVSSSALNEVKVYLSKICKYELNHKITVIL